MVSSVIPLPTFLWTCSLSPDVSVEGDITAEGEVKECKQKEGTKDGIREREATGAMVTRAVLNVLFDVYGHTHENVPVPVPLTEVKLVMV